MEPPVPLLESGSAILTSAVCILQFELSGAARSCVRQESFIASPELLISQVLVKLSVKLLTVSRRFVRYGLRPDVLKGICRRVFGFEPDQPAPPNLQSQI